MTGHTATTRKHVPRAKPAAGPGSGMRHIMPDGRLGGGSTATAGNGGPDTRAQSERDADGPEFTPVSLDSLHRVLDGLRRLN